MGLLENVNQFVLLFFDTIRQVARWRIWLVLLVYYLLQWLSLYVLYDYPAGPLGGGVARWVSLFGPQEATAFGHYPQHFLLLGKVAGWAKLALGLVLEGLVLGMVASMFYRSFGGGDTGVTTGSSFVVRWANLIVVWLVVNGLMLAAGQILPVWATPYLDGSRRVLAFSFVLMPFVFTLIFSVFLLAIPSVVIYKDHAFRAIGRSVRYFFRRPLSLFGLAAVILGLPILLGALASRPSGIVTSFKPELVYWILSVSLFIEMIAYFFWMGTAVRFLRGQER